MGSQNILRCTELHFTVLPFLKRISVLHSSTNLVTVPPYICSEIRLGHNFSELPMSLIVVLDVNLPVRQLQQFSWWAERTVFGLNGLDEIAQPLCYAVAYALEPDLQLVCQVW